MMDYETEIRNLLKTYGASESEIENFMKDLILAIRNGKEFDVEDELKNLED